MEEGDELTGDQRSRIKANHERALAIREQRKRLRPQEVVDSKKKAKESDFSSKYLDSSVQKLTALRDSHAGFMFDEDTDEQDQKHKYRRVEEDGTAITYFGKEESFILMQVMPISTFRAPLPLPPPIRCRAHLRGGALDFYLNPTSASHALVVAPKITPHTLSHLSPYWVYWGSEEVRCADLS